MHTIKVVLKCGVLVLAPYVCAVFGTLEWNFMEWHPVLRGIIGAIMGFSAWIAIGEGWSIRKEEDDV